MSKLESKAHTNNFSTISVLIFATLLILTSSLIFASFTPTAEGNVTMIRHTKDNQNMTSLKAGAGESGTATLRINTNVYPDSACGSAVKPCPNNKDMWFDFHVFQGQTWYYNGNIDGSPDTIVLQVPVAKSGKTDYTFSFGGPQTLTKPNLYGFWKPGDTSVKSCEGQLSDGQVSTCTVSIHWGFYS